VRPGAGHGAAERAAGRRGTDPRCRAQSPAHHGGSGMTGIQHGVAAALAASLLAAGCGAGGGSAPAGERAASRSALRIVVVSHGQASDPFWSVVANGLTDAADELGVRVEYQAPTSFDMVRMNQLM